MIINADGFSVTSFSVDPRYMNNGQTVNVSFKAKAIKAAVNGYLNVAVCSHGGEQVIYQSAKEPWYLNREKTVSFSFLMGDLPLDSEEKSNGYSDISFRFALEKDGDPNTVYTCQIDPEIGANGNIEWRYILVTPTRPQAAITSAALSDATKVNGGDASLYEYFGSIIKGHSKMTYTVTSHVPLNTSNPDNKWVEYSLSFRWSDGSYSEWVRNDTGVFGDPVGGYVPGVVSCYAQMKDLYHAGANVAAGTNVTDYAAPLLSNVIVERYNPDAVDAEGNHTYPADDAGTMVRFGFQSDVQAIAEKNAWSLTLEYGQVGTDSPNRKSLLSGTDGNTSSLSIESDEARNLLEDTVVPETERWYFTFILSDMVSSTSVTVYVGKAGGIFSIEKHGIGIGMRSQANDTDHSKVDVASGWRFTFHNQDGTIFDFPPNPEEVALYEGMTIVVSGGNLMWAKGGISGGGGGISPASATKSIAQQQYQNNTEVESIDLPGATTLGTYAFQNCTNLKTVNLPLVATIPAYCFSGCTALETVDLGAATSLAGSSFANCSALKVLILRASSRAAVLASSFTGSGIALKTCMIYVPSTLVATYKAASVWSTYKDQIFAIEDYPEITGG
jgi:hypothetical protein